MIDIDKLAKPLREPNLILREFNRLYHTRLGWEKYNYSGTNIFEDEDWDNLIILDSCRYDVFEELSDLPGKLQKRTSRGSMSKEFIVGNFSNKTLHDVVYLSGNSWYARMCKEINSEVHDFVLEKTPDGDKHYIDKPKRITRRAKELDEEYPNKRLIVHYMLPHAPYVGPYAEDNFPSEDEQRDFFYRFCRKEIADQQLWRAYKENLEIVLPMAEELLDTFRGKTVVTSDHGEMLGERSFPIPIKDYGHRINLHVPELTTVPWLVHEDGHKEIIEEPPEQDNLDGIESKKVEEHLKHLGYKM
ncbi:hypothetical protein ACM16X_05010 [Haloarcula japonica]|uniref:hypothetical protein n=1 Tax=Haloarcula japonica TaxID=29282 RepID=UPI0039F723D7